MIQPAKPPTILQQIHNKVMAMSTEPNIKDQDCTKDTQTQSTDKLMEEYKDFQVNLGNIIVHL